MSGLAGLVLVLAAAGASAQTSQPEAVVPLSASQIARRSHQELFKKVTATPLVVIPLRFIDGDPLDEAGVKAVRAAEGLLAEVKQLRAKGDYAAALEKATRAMGEFIGKLGSRDHRAASANVQVREIQEILRLDEQKRAQCAEADRLGIEAEQAYERGQYRRGVSVGARAIQIRERIFGLEHSSLGAVLRVVAGCQVELRMLAEAERNVSRAIKILEAAYGSNHPEVARALDRHGWKQIQNGEYRTAVDTLRRAVRIFSSVMGDCLEGAEALDNLGSALELTGEAAQALASKLRALWVRQQLAGPRSKDSGVSLSNLAWLYERMGKPEEVLALRKEALECFRESLGMDHPYTHLETSNLGLNYVRRGMFAEAARLYEQEVANDDKNPAPDDPEVIERRAQLAALYFRMGRQADGERMLRRAADLGFAMHQGGEARLAARQLFQVVSIYHKQRLLDDALAIAEKMKNWDDDVPEGELEDAILRGQQLGGLYLSHGRPRDAVEVLKRALERARQAYGPSDLRVGNVLLPLSEALAEAGEVEVAEKTCDQLIKMTEQRYAGRSRLGAMAMRTLGKIYRLEKKLDLSAFTLGEARLIFEEIKDAELDELISVLHEIAQTQRAQGDTQACARTLRDALQHTRELIEKEDKPWARAALARSLKRLLDVLPPDAPERPALLAELKSILEQLRGARMLDAENRAWMKELNIDQRQASTSGNS